MRQFLIVANRLKDTDLQIAASVKEEFHKYDSSAGIMIEDANAISAMALKNSLRERIPEQTECILVLGGDGTLIRVATDTVELGIPLIGINLGTLGYLTEAEQGNIPAAVHRLVTKEYHLEERMMLAGEVVCKDSTAGPLSALNDIVLTRRGDFQIIGYRVFVNGQYLNDFYADGMILSTPTGSTGYNLSAGGSIVEPKAKLIVLTPVCPHTLNARSIILSAEDRIEVEILPPKGEKPVEVEVCFDGRGQKILRPGDKVVISRSLRVTKMIKLSDVGFLEVLHKKMSV